MATASALTQNNPIECDELLKRCMGNLVLAQRVLKKYLDQVGVDVDSLFAAIAEQDVAESVRLAHKVRGTSLSVSAVEMSRLAHAIELLADTADKTELLALATNLESERSRIFNFLGTICIAPKDA